MARIAPRHWQETFPLAGDSGFSPLPPNSVPELDMSRKRGKFAKSRSLQVNPSRRYNHLADAHQQHSQLRQTAQSRHQDNPSTSPPLTNAGAPMNDQPPWTRHYSANATVSTGSDPANPVDVPPRTRHGRIRPYADPSVFRPFRPQGCRMSDRCQASAAGWLPWNGSPQKPGCGSSTA